jgi:hypothetical protein
MGVTLFKQVTPVSPAFNLGIAHNQPQAQPVESAASKPARWQSRIIPAGRRGKPEPKYPEPVIAFERGTRVKA